MKYSLSYFKSFTSENPFIIDESIINNLITINNNVCNISKDLVSQSVVYQFKPSKYVYEHKQLKENPIVDIKSNLNRVTSNNITTIVSNILPLLNDETFEIVFDISYKNKFLSKTFSELIILISEKNSLFGDFVRNKFDIIYNMFENVKYIPDTNYNEYCNNVKEIEERNAFCCLFSNLCLNDFIEASKIHCFVNHILDKVVVFLDDENKKN